MQNQTIIGLDVGRSAVKATAFAHGMFYPLTFPSIVSPAIDLTDESTARRAEAEIIEVHGKRYFTGDTARLQGSAGTTVGLSHDWINTPEYLALVGSTMKRFAARGVPGLSDPLLVIGTPASLYGSQQEQLKSETLKIVQADMRVLPQPMGAYCDFYLDKSGVPMKQHMQDSAGRKKSWAVIEVGHFTTDFLLMLEGQYIERGASSCEGLNFAAEHLLRILNGKGIHTNLIECEQAIRTKTILQFGQDVNIADDVAVAVSHVAQKIIAKADSLLSTDVRKLHGVLLAGGGAPLIVEELQKKWPHCVLLENPRMAVANGFCRYGMGIALRRAMKNQAQEAVNG
ncbi:ParM/StbA family protein [Cupriavidus sp. TMH.W2]|uniref:ParM/StbA family protein n=1 Tax=Cupriavidus sp. TMH.W2 TaxID=3434465 RepID=UPI003D77F3D9